MNLRIGDEVKSDNKHVNKWDGYTFGQNIKTKQEGFYPNYKVRPDPRLFELADFELWNDIKLLYVLINKNKMYN